MVTNADINVYQGDDWAGVVTVLDANDSPANLTGYTPAAQVRLNPGTPVLVEMLAAVAADPTTGVINLAMTSSDTAPLSCNYLWDMQVTDNAGVVTTLISGRVLVTQDITREAA